MAVAAGRGQTVLCCDWPHLDGTASAGAHLHVLGWAYCADGINEIIVIAGGHRFVPRVGLPRPDVEHDLSGLEGNVSGFTLVVDTRLWPSGPHEVIIRAVGRGNGGVAVRRGFVQIGQDAAYRAWRRNGAHKMAQEPEPATTVEKAAAALTVHVLEGGGAREALDASLGDQTHSHWSLAEGRLAQTLAATAATGNPVVLVEARGALDAGALARVSAVMNGAQAPDLVYADEDAVVADGGRGAAFLKPSWSPELLLSIDYVGPLVALGPSAATAALAVETGPPETIYEVLLRIIDAPLRVERIPETLFTSAMPRIPDDGPRMRASIDRLARRRGRRVRVAKSSRPGARDVYWELEGAPLVSLIIPTCLSGEHVAACLRSLRERTAYPNLEVIVVDSSPDGLGAVHGLLEDLAHRVVRYQGKFNFSEAVNEGARVASGEHLVLLNDDTEARSSDWVERMLQQLVVPGVGVVGAKLLLPDGHIQHAGVVLDLPGAGAWHVYAGFPADALGYHGMLHLTRNYSAVTGACMMVSRELFEGLGGFDPCFTAEFGDIDLCLRAVERGLRVTWTPHAVLTHRERSSFKMEVNKTDAKRFWYRWGWRYPGADPYYHPAFLQMSYEFPQIDEGARQLATLRPMDTHPRVEVAEAESTGFDAEKFAPPPASFEGVEKAVAAGDLVMWCETPVLDGTGSAEGHLTVRGWAYAHAGLSGVFAYVDGVRYRVGRGTYRPDLRALFGEALSRAGFELKIELDEQQRGRLDVAVVARSVEGHAVGMRGQVECRPSGHLPGAFATSARLEAPGTSSEAPSGGSVERFVPDEASGTLMESEHEARYRWATEAIRGREVLDAGCGVGYGTAALTRAGAARAIGIDISEDAISTAHERFGHVGGFVVGDLRELPFADDSFDAVVCFEAIEHVSDWGRALDEFRRVLRRAGLLLLSTPNRAVYKPGNPYHVHEFLPDELRDTLSQRFPEVRLYRQQSHFCSLICDDATFERGQPSEDVPSRLRKLARARPGEELYTLALAGIAPLPELSSLTLLGGAFDGEAWRELTFWCQERVLVAEASAAASAADASEARRERERALDLLVVAEQGRRHAEGTLADQTASLSWRLTRPLRWAKRELRRRGG